MCSFRFPSLRVSFLLFTLLPLCWKVLLMGPTIQISIPSRPDADRFKTCTTFKPFFQLPIASKLESPLSLLLSTPNPDPDRFKTCTTFKPTFKLRILSKPALPLSLLFNSRSHSIQTLNSVTLTFQLQTPGQNPITSKTLTAFKPTFQILSRSLQNLNSL